MFPTLQIDMPRFETVTRVFDARLEFCRVRAQYLQGLASPDIAKRLTQDLFLLKVVPD